MDTPTQARALPQTHTHTYSDTYTHRVLCTVMSWKWFCSCCDIYDWSNTKNANLPFLLSPSTDTVTGTHKILCSVMWWKCVWVWHQTLLCILPPWTVVQHCYTFRIVCVCTVWYWFISELLHSLYPSFRPFPYLFFWFSAIFNWFYRLISNTRCTFLLWKSVKWKGSIA